MLLVKHDRRNTRQAVPTNLVFVVVKLQRRVELDFPMRKHMQA